jgi:hypothetical protein
MTGVVIASLGDIAHTATAAAVYFAAARTIPGKASFQHVRTRTDIALGHAPSRPARSRARVGSVSPAQCSALARRRCFRRSLCFLVHATMKALRRAHSALAGRSVLPCNHVRPLADTPCRQAFPLAGGTGLPGRSCAWFSEAAAGQRSRHGTCVTVRWSTIQRVLCVTRRCPPACSPISPHRDGRFGPVAGWLWLDIDVAMPKVPRFQSPAPVGHGVLTAARTLVRAAVVYSGASGASHDRWLEFGARSLTVPNGPAGDPPDRVPTSG